MKLINILIPVFLVLIISNTIIAQTSLSEQPVAAKNGLSGWATAVDGNWALIASPQKDNGDIQSVGEVAFLNYNSERWAMKQTIQPNNLPALSNFGVSVAIDGTTAMVGSIGDHRNGLFSGTIFVYELEGDVWVHSNNIKGSNTKIGSRFGNATDLKGNLLISGAYMGDGNERKSGVAYIFEKVEGEWIETALLKADNGDNGDYFGNSVQIINNNTMAVGAYRADGVENETGAVYIFKRSENGWTETKKLTIPSGNNFDVFGYRLSSIQLDNFLSEERSFLLVGSPGYDTENEQTGAVFVFQYQNDEWSLIRTLVHENLLHNSQFGTSIAANNRGEFFVGASRMHSENKRESGRVYSYNIELQNENISFLSNLVLKSNSEMEFDHFGSIVSATDEFVLISAPFRNRNDLVNAGETYFYSRTAVSNEQELETINSFKLHQNYPNPFNPSTVISYQLPEASKVQLEVFDITGRKVAKLLNERVQAGIHEVNFDASNLASGIYIYRLTIQSQSAGSRSLTKKLTLIK